MVVGRRHIDPSMPGLFIVETAAGMVARRLESIPHDVPQKVLKIRGRIVGMWRRL